MTPDQHSFVIRHATFEDVPALTALIEASVRGLQTRDYTAAQIDASLRGAYGIDRQLIEDQTYFVATPADDPFHFVACGGWSYRATLHGSDRFANRDPAIVDPSTGYAKIRAIFVHPDWARRGLGTLLLERSESAAKACGYRHLEMASTLTGVPLYSTRGYVETERVMLSLPENLTREIVYMRKTLS